MGRAFEYRRASKEKRWDAMSKLYPKLGRVITMAAKEGGPDPESNGKLKTAIQNARAQSLPRDNIEAAIKRASGKDAVDIKETFYEAKGPHGVLLYIECATDNVNRTSANLKVHLNKTGGQMVQSGSLDFLFSRKAVIEFAKAEEMGLDEIELALIDAGLEELEVDGDTVYVYGDLKDFGTLSAAVEKLGIEATKSELQRIPTSPTKFSEEQMAEIEVLIDRLEDDEDVQQVFTNIA